MIFRFIILLILPLLCLSSTKAQNSDYLAYIDKYKKLAIKEMERAGVPASIKLAQALLESNAGKSTIARKANNHFGMKCGSQSQWKGKKFYREDDDYDENGNLLKSCFRSYRKAVDSYVAHSEFLRDPRKAHRYGFLFRIKTTDYKKWARGLKKSGYATAGGYDTKLIRLIETYNLDQYDKSGKNAFPDRPDKGLIAGVDLQKVNGIRVIFAKNNITPQEISSKASVSTRALKRYNENLPEVGDSLPDDYRVFLQPKRNKFRGKKKWHYVKEGETMFDLSQEYGVKMRKLYKRNRMKEGTQPQPEQRIKLRGFKVKAAEKPRLSTEPTPDNVPVIIDSGDGFMYEEITPENPTTTPTTTTTPPPTTTYPDQPTAHPDPPIYQPDPEPIVDASYTVTKGDTLYSISRRFGLTVNQLMQMNSLSSTTIYIGQVLQIK